MTRFHVGGIRRRYVLGRRRFRAVRDLLVAADRVRDRFNDADVAERRRLWAELHVRADELREALS